MSPVHPGGLSLARLTLFPPPGCPPPPPPFDAHTPRTSWILCPHFVAFTMTFVILWPLAQMSSPPPTPQGQWQHIPPACSALSLGDHPAREQLQGQKETCPQIPPPLCPWLLAQRLARSWLRTAFLNS